MYKKLLLLILCLCGNTIITAKYYSQIGQDRFLNENCFKNKYNGIFVDIGAYDGVYFSNTYFFEAERNWTGICFEPLPSVFKLLQSRRKSICINAAVAPIAGTVKFQAITGFDNVHGVAAMLSGVVDKYDPRHVERINKELHIFGGSYEYIDVKAVRFNDVMREYNINYIDYLSLDTEGGELEILQSIDFEKIYIYAISVENNYNDVRQKEFLESKGFKKVATIEWDEIFINTQEKYGR